MRGFGTLLVCTVVACGGSGTKGSTKPRAPLTPKDIVAQSTPAIVRIEAGEGTGTGFIVDQRGLVATNLHVVAGNEVVKVKLHDGNVYPVMAIASVDPGRDLALLRIAAPRPLPVVRLGDSNNLSAGDQVVAIGNPLGVFDELGVERPRVAGPRRVLAGSGRAQPAAPGALRRADRAVQAAAAVRAGAPARTPPRASRSR